MIEADYVRTSASSKIRIERIDKILPYNKAFDFITKFYSQTGKSDKGKGKEKVTNLSDEIDLTGSDDEMLLDDETGEKMEELPGGSQANAVVDPINLASGLPCELIKPRKRKAVADGKAEEAVLAIVDFPKQVVVAFSIIIQYMKGQLYSIDY